MPSWTGIAVSLFSFLLSRSLARARYSYSVRLCVGVGRETEPIVIIHTIIHPSFRAMMTMTVMLHKNENWQRHCTLLNAFLLTTKKNVHEEAKSKPWKTMFCVIFFSLSLYLSACCFTASSFSSASSLIMSPWLYWLCTEHFWLSSLTYIHFFSLSFRLFSRCVRFYACQQSFGPFHKSIFGEIVLGKW